MIHNHEVPGSIPGLATKNALHPKSIFCLYYLFSSILAAFSLFDENENCLSILL